MSYTKNLFKFATLALIAGPFANADEAFIGYGVGVFHDADDFLGQMKAGEIGYRSFIFEGLYWQNKGGFWGEGSNDKTRSSSGYFSTGIGLEVDLQPLELRSGYGLAAITTPDSQLGSIFPQFQGEVYVGVRDKVGDGLGLQYSHLSCASFCTPNQGRDFISILLSQKW